MSQQPPHSGLQNITFALSTDLIHWHDAEGQYGWFDIDETHYQRPGRWDCIDSFPLPNQLPNSTDPAAGPRFGAWTATPRHPDPTTGGNGLWGFGVSHDGVHWRALPSPPIDWSEALPGQRMNADGELGGIRRFARDGLYYAMVGYHMRMVHFCATSPLGPWRPARHNWNLLEADGYFTRFFEVPSGC